MGVRTSQKGRLFVALAFHFSHLRRASAVLLAAALLCAGGFLALKAVEYAHHFEAGELPGLYTSASQ